MTRLSPLPDRGCAVGGCERPHEAHGWCRLHYRRWQNHGDPLVVTGKRPQENDYWIVGGIAYVDVSTRTHPHAIGLVDVGACEHIFDGRGRWAASRPAGSLTIYVARHTPRPNRETIFLHRFLLGLERGDPTLADHENRDGLDNRRANLRAASHAQNQQNRISRKGPSRFKGVRPRNDVWHAYIGAGGRHRHLGAFSTEGAAARAYDAAAREAFGSFALLNFPQEWAEQQAIEEAA